MVFSLIDIIFICFLIVMALIGYKKGFISELYNLLSTIIVIVLSSLLVEPLSSVVHLYPYDEGNVLSSLIGVFVNRFFLFLVLLICLFFVKKLFGFFVKPLLNKLISVFSITDFINSFLGLLLSVIKGSILFYLILVLVFIPFVPHGKEMIATSALTSFFVENAPNFSMPLIDSLSDYKDGFSSPEAVIDVFFKAYDNNMISDEQMSQFFNQYVQDNSSLHNIHLDDEKLKAFQNILIKNGYNQKDIQKLLEKLR